MFFFVLSDGIISRLGIKDECKVWNQDISVHIIISYVSYLYLIKSKPPNYQLNKGAYLTPNGQKLQLGLIIVFPIQSNHIIWMFIKSID